MIQLRFVCDIYREQVDGQRYFLHEHPAGAASWREKCVEATGKMDGGDLATGDQCQYGQEFHDEPVKKPATWMRNSPRIFGGTR